MRDRSPYSPDRSLLLAVGVLVGGILLCFGGAYAVSFLSIGTGDGVVIANGNEDTSTPSGHALKKAPRRRGGASSIAGGRTPGWAGSDLPSTPSRARASSPQDRYDIDPDFGHAQLGAPSVSSGDRPEAGVSADAGASGGSSSHGKIPGTAFSVPDLGGSSVGRAASGDDGPGWRTEARALARRSRALSTELGRLSREMRRESRYETTRKENGPSGDATTASRVGARSNSAPGTPDDPDQVPLGGAEWLAAAGAAYAFNRLRKTGEEESEGDA